MKIKIKDDDTLNDGYYEVSSYSTHAYYVLAKKENIKDKDMKNIPDEFKWRVPMESVVGDRIEHLPKPEDVSCPKMKECKNATLGCSFQTFLDYAIRVVDCRCLELKDVEK